MRVDYGLFDSESSICNPVQVNARRLRVQVCAENVGSEGVFLVLVAVGRPYPFTNHKNTQINAATPHQPARKPPIIRGEGT